MELKSVAAAVVTSTVKRIIGRMLQGRAQQIVLSINASYYENIGAFVSGNAARAQAYSTEPVQKWN